VTTPIRVAHVIHNLEPGGTERRLLAVAAALEPPRFESLVACLDGLGPLREEAVAAGIVPILIGRSWRFDVTGVLRLALLLRRERVAIVHGWMWLPGVFARVAGVLARVPVRVVGEGAAVTTNDPRRARSGALLDRLLAPLTDTWVANSEAVAASLRERGLPADRIVVVPNGVALPAPLDPEERRLLREELGAEPGAELVGMVARLDPEFKDHATLLRAVAQLEADGRPIRVAVVGDGPGRVALERHALDLGIADRVRFTGFRRDSARLVAALDVSVLLTYSEGFSNVVLESMAAGVPLLATDIAPNREAVHDGVHALLVPVGDVEATAAALRRLLDDSSLAAALGAAARDRARADFSLEAQGARMASLYERLLREKSG